MDAATAEASKIRSEENADYLKASKDFGDSAKAVAAAIEVLRSYYEGAFIQLAAKTTAEDTASAAFAQLSQENAVTKASKEAEIKGKQSEIRSLSTNLQNYNEDKAAVGGELDAVLSYLDKLKPECEVKVMSYEEKVARREAEIDGLKEAL